jgi:hypothetical protein
MSTWKWNFLTAPANGQNVFVRTNYFMPAFTATYHAGTQTFELQDGRQLPFWVVWKWRPV